MGNDQLLARNLEAANWAALKFLFLHSNPAFRTLWDTRGTARKSLGASESGKESPDHTLELGPTLQGR